MKILALASFAIATLFAADITIENPYAKEVAPSMKNSAAFMKIKNSSDKPIYLLSATSDVSKITELHTHEMKNGMMSMHQVEKIEVPAKGEVALKPMGYHIMLIDLNKSIKDGESINLDLKFSDGENIKVVTPVKKFR